MRSRRAHASLCHAEAVDLDRAGRTPLHYAAAEGDIAFVRELLRDGADPAVPDKAGFTPLHFAAQGQHAEVVAILVQAGAPTEAQDQWGNTPLFRAVGTSRGKGDTIRALLDAGADPDAANNTGLSPRAAAHKIANFAVAQFIPERGQ